MAMWNSRSKRRLTLTLLAATAAASCLHAEVSLHALPEFFRPDPFGGVVACDRKGSPQTSAIRLTAARGGYVSFHVTAQVLQSDSYQIAFDFPLSRDIYREWFHFNSPDRTYYPDALIPI